LLRHLLRHLLRFRQRRCCACCEQLRANVQAAEPRRTCRCDDACHALHAEHIAQPCCGAQRAQQQRQRGCIEANIGQVAQLCVRCVRLDALQHTQDEAQR
jgi:hypothetical protein